MKQYHKPALSFEQQIRQLEDRGLVITNRVKAIHLLKNIGYYRLSGYWFPLLEEPKKDHRFKQGASFEQVFRLYCFDRELRLILLGEIEKVEVSVRTQIIYEPSVLYGPYWFEDANHFRNLEIHSNFIREFKKELSRSKEEFILEFKRSYENPYPPSWILFEILSFGSISSVYNNIKHGQIKRRIAHSYGVDETTFGSWLHTLVYLRNICAHHSRLWNRELHISPKLPRGKGASQFEGFPRTNGNAKVYSSIAVLYFLMNGINPSHSIKNRLVQLFEKFPEVDHRAMGFPDRWQSQKFWNPTV